METKAEANRYNSSVIKIADDGLVTLSMPEAAGQYLVVEQEAGRIILEPYDLRWSSPGTALTRVGEQLHLGPILRRPIPEA